MAIDTATTSHQAESPATTEVLLQRVHTIEPILREHAKLAEQTCRLPEAGVTAMREAGLYGMWVPRALGGLELDPMSAFRVLEEVSRIDGAAGWNLQLSVAFCPFGAWLPDAGAREIFSRDTVVAGTLFPPAQVVPAPGGYRLSGRSPFVSGAHNATWFAGPANIIDNGRPRTTGGVPVTQLVFFPRADAEIIDNWDTLGMRGTGSHDVTATDAFVPEHRTGELVPFSVKAPGTFYTGPLYRFTIWHSVVVLAAPALGIARAAIDDLIELAQAKTPAYTGTSLRERSVAQSQIAQAQAHLGAARAYVHEALAEVWETALSGDVLSLEQRMKLQLAGCHGVQAAAAAVRLVHVAAGGTAIRKGHRFEQYFRNVHTITQHAFVSASRWESAGQLMFGLDSDWPFFAL